MGTPTAILYLRMQPEAIVACGNCKRGLPTVIFDDSVMLAKRTDAAIDLKLSSQSSEC